MDVQDKNTQTKTQIAFIHSFTTDLINSSPEEGLEYAKLALERSKKIGDLYKFR